MFTRILVGVDGSDSALKAVDTAAALAAAHGAELLVGHVVQVSAIAEQAMKVTATDHLGDKPKRIMEQLSGDILEAARARALGAGIDEKHVTTFGTDGDQARRLIQAARERDADLIVVGGRGRGRLEGLLLGSVTQKVVAHAPCPCLVVP